MQTIGHLQGTYLNVFTFYTIVFSWILRQGNGTKLSQFDKEVLHFKFILALDSRGK